MRLFLILVLATSVAAATRPVTFSYRPDRDVKTVAVAGSFNGWAAAAHPMKRAGVGGPFEVTVELPEGRHTYKFVIDGAFTADPRAKERVPDGFGGYNSVIGVGAVDARPAVRGDGVISAGFVRHRPGRDAGYTAGGRVALRLMVRANDVERVTLITDRATHDAPQVATDGDEALHEVLLDRAPARFSFRVHDGAKTLAVGPFAAATIRPYGAPRWLREAVFYQIFPDRFRNGDRSNDPAGATWGDPPFNTSWSGGDLAGVQQGLDYLQRLGVNALYLNPIFAADSNHGYNTADYETVARRFGGNAGFSALLADLRRRGMRVILDGVYNHTGTAFFAFQDLVARGAASKYRDWYTVKSWPIDLTSKHPNYECWWGFGSLPKLRVDDNPQVADYLLGTVATWTRAGIDGWRLDVPNEVGHPFWKRFRSLVRSINPSAYIVGEIWEDGSAWLEGDEFDAVMNYRFRRALVEFLAKGAIDATAAARQLDRVRMDYAPDVTRSLYNLLGSHDTERFLTLAGNAEWKLAAATTALATAPGVPSIYYGDEIAMEGGKDPDNRRSFLWGRTLGHPMLTHTRRAFGLRRAAALGDFGEASHFAISADILGFERRNAEGQRLMVLINRGEAGPLPARAGSLRVVLGTPNTLAARATTVLMGR